MRHYEIMIILDPNLEERSVQPSLEGFLKVVTAGGGKVEKTDIWGKRRLAYPIEKKPEGVFTRLTISQASTTPTSSRPNPGARPMLRRRRRGAAWVVASSVIDG